MMKFLKIAMAICGTALAADTQTALAADTQTACPEMKTIFLTKRWELLTKKGSTLENVKLVAPPGLKKALMIRGENITLRNVIVHHSASNNGIHVFKSKNITMENVEVRAYGNEKGGPNPCSNENNKGWLCQNILVWDGPNFKAKNLRLYGADGLKLNMAPNSHVDGIDVRNVRGSFPAWSGISVQKGHNTVIENFYIKNDNSSWTGDIVNFHGTSNPTLRNGTIDG